MPFDTLITESEGTILLALAQKGKRTFKQLLKSDKVANSNKTILYAVKKLEYLELIKSRKGKNVSHSGRGRKATYYSITLNGLIFAFYLFFDKTFQDVYTDVEFENILENMAANQKDLLPLIFGKWSFYKENEILEDVIIRLGLTTRQIIKFVVRHTKFTHGIMQNQLDEEKKLKKQHDAFKELLPESERKKLPKHPFFWSDKERENDLEVYVRNMQRTELKYGFIPDHSAEEEINTLVNAYKTIERLVDENHLTDFYETFFFINDILRHNEIKPEDDKTFLLTIIKDSDLRDFTLSYAQELEKKYNKYLNDIRSTIKTLKNFDS